MDSLGPVVIIEDDIDDKEMLELVLEKIESLRQLEGRPKADATPVKEKSSWKLF